MKLAWVTSWDRVCGIATYSQGILPYITEYASIKNVDVELVSIDKYPPSQALIERLELLKPDHIHFQHEYGLFGGKNPPFYSFPKIIRKLRGQLPVTKITATAHTVISEDYKYTLNGKGLQIPLRSLLNLFFLPYLRKIWGRDTFGNLDSVIVHSQSQKSLVEQAGCKNVAVVPHYVYEQSVCGKDPQGEISRHALLDRDGIKNKKLLLMFGFFRLDKAQDLAIEAFHLFCKTAQGKDFVLILAGSAQTQEDKIYYDKCMSLVESLDLKDRVFVTGYVENKYLHGLYNAAEVVLAPFRWSSGSGSLSMAMAHGACVLCSDLEVNLELNERVEGCLEYFKVGSPQSCADKIQELITHPEKIKKIKTQAALYAQKYRASEVAESYFKALL